MGSTSADAAVQEIRRRRVAGKVYAAQSEATGLTAVAADLGLSTDRETYVRIEADEARRVLVRVLHRDLAYDEELMPLGDAERLADAILGLVPGAQLYTNGTFGQLRDGETPSDASWNPATAATLDTGVIGLSPSGAVCVWVADED